MRQDSAFKFIPELIGDFTHVMEMSESPRLLYVETAINALHAATDIFNVIEEHTNTKRMEQTKEPLKKRYDELEQARIINYERETIQRMDVEYAKLKDRIRDGQLKDKAVRAFINSLKDELHKAIDILNKTQIEPNVPKRASIEETVRKAIKAYNNLLSILIEEDRNNGKE